MKKLVFAAAAAFAIVSASNVFAFNGNTSSSFAAPTDTVAPADTTVAPSTPAEPVKQSLTSDTVAPAKPDTTVSAQLDTVAPAKPDTVAPSKSDETLSLD